MKKRRSSKKNVVTDTLAQTKTFNFEDYDIRIVDKDGNPWFVVRDIGRALEVSNEAIDKAVSKIKQEYKGSIAIRDKKVLIVSEQGLYKILIRSQSPKAEKFQDWITEEVLPSIRKKGYYASENISPLEALRHTVDALVEQDRRLKAQEAELQKQGGKLVVVDERVSTLEHVSDTSQREFERIELSNKSAREQTKRSLINRTIRAFSTKHGIPFNLVWRELYREVYYRLSIDIPARQRNKEKDGENISKLQIAEDLGILDDMWDILSHMMRKNTNKFTITKSKKDRDRKWMKDRRRRADEDEDEYYNMN